MLSKVSRKQKETHLQTRGAAYSVYHPNLHEQTFLQTRGAAYSLYHPNLHKENYA